MVTYTDKHITSPPPSSPRAWMGATPGPLCPQPPAHVGKPNHFILFYFVLKNHCNTTGIGTKRGLCSAFVNFSADACKRRRRVNIDFPLKQAPGFIDCRGEGSPAAARGWRSQPVEHRRSLATECHPCKKAAACSAAHAGCRDPAARSQRGKSQPQGGFPRGKGAAGGKPLSRAGREGQEKGLPGGHSEPPASSAAVSAFRARAGSQNLAAFIKGPRVPRARSRGRRSRVTAHKSSRRGLGLFLLPPPRLGPTGSWPPPRELRAPGHASPGHMAPHGMARAHRAQAPC